MGKEERKSVEKASHKERVAMRQLLRESGVISSDADNDEADRWLLRHGYLYNAGYKPPKDRVQKLAHNLGLEVPNIKTSYRGKR